MRWEMMAAQKNDKIERVLRIYTKLLNGNLVNKAEEAIKYGVNERSIQRDMDDIRNFLALEQAANGCIYSIIYDRGKKGYRMQKVQQTQFTNGELLAMSKLLLGSQAFSKNELNGLLEKIIAHCDAPDDQKLLKSLVGNEMFHYMEQHRADLMEVLWELGQAVQGCHYIDIIWPDSEQSTTVSKRLKPVAILYMNQFFYLAAFEDKAGQGEEDKALGQSSPEVFRIDQIQQLKVLEERFHIPYSKRFEEGEFRKKALDLCRMDGKR